MDEHNNNIMHTLCTNGTIDSIVKPKLQPTSVLHDRDLYLWLLSNLQLCTLVPTLDRLINHNFSLCHNIIIISVLTIPLPHRKEVVTTHRFNFHG